VQTVRLTLATNGSMGICALALRLASLLERHFSRFHTTMAAALGQTRVMAME